VSCATFARKLETAPAFDAKTTSQAKSKNLHLGEPNNSFEREASDSHRRAANGAQPLAMPPIVHEVLSSPGQSLDPEIRAFVEPGFGHDFGQVRVHVDERAAESARQVNALAYTVGQDVVFAQGEFQPWTSSGLKLVAHELTHTLQQGTTSSKAGSLRISQPDDTEEQTADRMAAGVVSGNPVSSVAAVTSATLQRQKASTGVAGSGSQPVSGEARLIASFDVDPGTKRPWNLNQLTQAIVQALSASDLAYVRILGVYPTKAKEDDPQGNAYQRADLVRRALIQWIGPRKFSEDRFNIDFAGGSIGDPQVQVVIAYKERVLSEPKTPLPAQAQPKPLPSTKPAPAAPAPPSLDPSKPYPGQATKAFSAFLETPTGKKFKDAALLELRRGWKETSTGEKIAILISLLAFFGAATYGLARMSPSERSGILNLIVGDEDKFLQAPLPEKEFPGLPLKFPF
jgi:hypothetical protein